MDLFSLGEKDKETKEIVIKSSILRKLVREPI